MLPEQSRPQSHRCMLHVFVAQIPEYVYESLLAQAYKIELTPATAIAQKIWLSLLFLESKKLYASAAFAHLHTRAPLTFGMAFSYS